MNVACRKNNVALTDDNDYVAKRQKTQIKQAETKTWSRK